MFTELFKQRFHVILLVLGFLLVLAGIFTIKDFSKFDVSARSQLVWSSVIIGVILIAIAIILNVLGSETFEPLTLSKIKTIDRGYSIIKGRTCINVIFGRIEEFDCSSDDCLVVLPANEFFDDECIYDKRSSLGAFIQRHFYADIVKLQKLVQKQLAGYQFTDVEKEPGIYGKSFGIGTCIFLNKPLSTSLRIAMLSVTTKRVGEGLRAEARNIFDCVFTAHRIMVDYRLSRLYIPVIGSGHGGIRPELALLCMLISFSEALRKPSGHHLQSVSIVVFESSKTSVPSISRKEIKKALAFVVENS